MDLEEEKIENLTSQDLIRQDSNRKDLNRHNLESQYLVSFNYMALDILPWFVYVINVALCAVNYDPNLSRNRIRPRRRFKYHFSHIFHKRIKHHFHNQFPNHLWRRLNCQDPIASYIPELMPHCLCICCHLLRCW